MKTLFFSLTIRLLTEMVFFFRVERINIRLKIQPQHNTMISCLYHKI